MNRMPTDLDLQPFADALRRFLDTHGFDELSLQAGATGLTVSARRAPFVFHAACGIDAARGRAVARAGGPATDPRPPATGLVVPCVPAQPG